MKKIKAPLEAPPNVEVLRRDTVIDKHLVIVNHNDSEVELSLEQNNLYINLLTDEKVKTSIKIGPVDVAILKYN